MRSPRIALWRALVLDLQVVLHAPIAHVRLGGFWSLPKEESFKFSLLSTLFTALPIGDFHFPFQLLSWEENDASLFHTSTASFDYQGLILESVFVLQ